jgi:hypothetical protein
MRLIFRRQPKYLKNRFEMMNALGEMIPPPSNQRCKK